MILFIIAIIIVLFFCFDSAKKFKITKQKIAKLYGVSRKTFSKWIYHFDTFGLKQGWSSMRKLNLLHLACIFWDLGIGSKNDCLTKTALRKVCETPYKTLRECVKKNEKGFGMSLKTYVSMDKFPPRVSQRIVQMHV